MTAAKTNIYTMHRRRTVSAESTQYALLTLGKKTYNSAIIVPATACRISTPVGAPRLLCRENMGGILPSRATTPRPTAGPISHACKRAIPPGVTRTAKGARSHVKLNAFRKSVRGLRMKLRL